VVKLKENGLHHTEEGLRLINLTLSQMNSYRLSTSEAPEVDRAQIHADIQQLLTFPSNYEIREGKV